MAEVLNTNAPAIWGTDCLLVDGDLVPSATGDISIVNSIEGVKQAIINRLRTEIGDLLYNVNYGVNLDLLIGQKHTPEREQILRLAIIQTLKQEPRIETISQVQVLSDKNRNDILYVSIVVIPTAIQNTLSLNLVYPYWTLTLVEPMSDEQTTSINNNIVDVSYDIYTVQGVWSASDIKHTGTNYYLPNGSYVGRRIVLGTRLDSNFGDVLVNYTRKVMPT
jgi:phage baseplate assembly protein W